MEKYLQRTSEHYRSLHAEKQNMEQWLNIICCYARLGKHEIVRQLLQENCPEKPGMLRRILSAYASGIGNAAEIDRLIETFPYVALSLACLIS